MLKVIIGIAILLVIAFVGYRRTFTRLRLPAGARFFFLTGTEFIFVGVALGSDLIGLLDEQTIRSLTPLFSLGLGFIGLIFGIQLEFDKIFRFPKSFLLIAAVQAAVTMLVIFIPFYYALQRMFPATQHFALLASMMLAATAACTAPTVLALLGREFRLTGAPVMELLRYIASLDSVAGLTTFGFMFCLMHAFSPQGFDLSLSLFWFALSVALGIAMGFLLHMLTQIQCSDEEMLIFVTGMIVFSGGIALYLRLSPLFVNMVMGATIANSPGSKNRIFNLLAQMEKPFYIVFLIIAGAIWHPGPLWAYLMAALYLALRFLGKVSGGYLAAKAAASRFRAPKRLGLGLLSLGGVVIAMVMNWYQLNASELTDAVVSMVLTAVIINELASPTLIKVLLRRVGEIEQ